MSCRDFEENILETIKKYNMLREGERVLVALSGGGDSVALTHALSRLAGRLGIFLSALHVNHMLRGEAAAADAEFCERFCAEMGIPFKLIEIDVPAMAKVSGQGFEECAREVRYAALSEYCKESGCTKIATGHSASDNLETVIFNLTRGAGLKGSGGIAPVRGNIIRPLLSLTREEILKYLQEARLSYRTDSTNSDLNYSRNKIRAVVLPALKEINPSVERTVLENCTFLRTDASYMESLTEEVLRPFEDGLPLDVLTAQDMSMRSNAVRLLYSRVSQGESLSAQHVKKILAQGFLFEHKSMDLPGKIKCKIQNNKLIFTKSDEVEKTPPIPETRLNLHGETLLPKQNLVISCEILPPGEYDGICINFEKAAKGIMVRSRREGDRISFAFGHKSIKKLLNEKKIPAEKRDFIPIIIANGEIAAVCGVGVSLDYLPQEGKSVIKIKIKKLEDKGYAGRN